VNGRIYRLSAARVWVNVRAMVKTIVMLVTLAACSKSEPRTKIDCDAYMAHLDELALRSIAELPADKHEAAEKRRIEGRDAVVQQCRETATVTVAYYDCVMKSQTTAEFKACP
jgi:hypothetical protein